MSRLYFFPAPLSSSVAIPLSFKKQDFLAVKTSKVFMQIKTYPKNLV